MKNAFNFFVNADIPEDVYKAAKEAKGDKRYDNMIVEGLASDSSEDSEGEIMEPNGFDIKDFLSSGLINLEHFTSRKGDPDYWIGEPVSGYVKDNKFFVKAKLWKAKPYARNLWDTCIAMKESGSTRRPGFSIEGKALERHPINKKRVTKAKINNLAITFSPVNKNSYFDIIKGEQEEDFVKDKQTDNSKSKYMFEFEKGGKNYGVTKDFKVEEKEDEEKAVTTETAKPLRREELDSKVKNLLVKSLRSGKISPKKAFNLIKSFYNS
jgi:hypothetical protein